MTGSDGLLGEIDWSHFARYWWKGVGRLPVLILMSIAMYLGLHNFAQLAPQEAQEISKAIEFAVVNWQVNMIEVLFKMMFLWAIFPLLQALIAFKPLVMKVRKS